VDFGQVELRVSEGGDISLVSCLVPYTSSRAVSAVGQRLKLTQLIEHTGPTLETLRISSLSRVEIRTRIFLVQVERAKLPLGQRVPRAYVAVAGQWPSVLSH
jgi:hypothetical protein